MDNIPGIVEEVTINSSPNRLLLTNVHVMEEISKRTGASIVCKGKYVSMQQSAIAAVREDERPLFLEIRAPTHAAIRETVSLIQGLHNQTPDQSYHEEIFSLDFLTRTLPKRFPVRHKLLGDNKINFKYISKMTSNSKILLRGRVPTMEIHFLGTLTGSPNDRIHVVVQSPCKLMFEKAKRLLEALCERVKNYVKKFEMKQEKRRKEMEQTRREMESEQQKKLEMMKDEDEDEDEDESHDIQMKTNPYMMGLMHLRKLQGGARLRVEEAGYAPNINDYQPRMVKKYKTNINSIRQMLGEPEIVRKVDPFEAARELQQQQNRPSSQNNEQSGMRNEKPFQPKFQPKRQEYVQKEYNLGSQQQRSQSQNQYQPPQRQNYQSRNTMGERQPQTQQQPQQQQQRPPPQQQRWNNNSNNSNYRGQRGGSSGGGGSYNPSGQTSQPTQQMSQQQQQRRRLGPSLPPTFQSQQQPQQYPTNLYLQNNQPPQQQQQQQQYPSYFMNHGYQTQYMQGYVPQQPQPQPQPQQPQQMMTQQQQQYMNTQRSYMNQSGNENVNKRMADDLFS